jgi:hypothetical protein
LANVTTLVDLEQPAIFDALAPLGITNLTSPATPQAIWGALRG